MDLFGLGGLLVVFLFTGLMIAFWVINTRRQGNHIRSIPALERTQRAIDLAVEDGSRTHVSLGNTDLSQSNSAASLIGLSILRSVSDIAADSDKPPVATSSIPLTTLIAQDTLRSSYARTGALESFDIALGRVTGLTPFSSAAGAFPIIRDEDVSANLLFGDFGNEVALLAADGHGKGVTTLAGTNKVAAQAILYAAAEEQLRGEEVFSAGA